MELYPGAVIAGRYRIDRKIGSGGMGEVWAGEHVNIGVRVALKTLLPGAALDEQLVARFRREAQLLGRLRSDRVARVVDFIEDRQVGLLLVMDYVEGELLGDVLVSRRLGIEEAVDLGVDIVSALCDLHRARVVHRDLKPDNIILEPLSGGRRRAVIVDLGVSRLEPEPGDESVTSITHVDTAVGTLPYMAPEQLLSSSTATASADVYAVGAILFRAISGEQVFGDADDAAAARRKLVDEAPPLSLARVDRVARGFAAVVAQALQRHPGQRFQSAEDMLRELTTLQDLARATALDLDATTEEAFPISALGFAASLGGPPTETSPPPALSSAGASTAPRTAPSPAAITPAPGAPAPPEESAGEPTERMARPAVDEGDLFDGEGTLHSPTSQPPPPADPPSSATISDPRTMSSPRLSRPTVLSPASPPAAAPTLVVPAPVDEPLARSTGKPLAAVRRTVPLRAAVIGLVAALAAGAALGFEAHRLISPRAVHPAGAGR